MGSASDTTWTPTPEQIETLVRLAYQIDEGEEPPEIDAIGAWWRARVRAWLGGSETPRTQGMKAARVAVLAVAEQMRATTYTPGHPCPICGRAVCAVCGDAAGDEHGLIAQADGRMANLECVRREGGSK